MIKFIPECQILIAPIGLNQGSDQINNKGNRSLANQMEKALEGKQCPDHPDFQNVIEVDISRGHDFMKVNTYCCENFKVILELIAENQNPFD